MTVSKVLERKDVPRESKWNAQAVFPSWDQWSAEAEALTADLPQLSTYDGKLAQGPTELAGWLELFTTLDRRLMRLFVYARVATAVDANDMTAKENMGQMMGLYAQFKAVTAFAEPAMLQLGETPLAWAKEDPRLKLYEHYFADLLRQKDHRRSAEVEEILGLVADPFSQTYRTAMELTNLDMTFPDALDSQGRNHPVVQATVPPSGIQNPDRELRRTAWENYCDVFLGLKNTLAGNYIASVKQNLFWKTLPSNGRVKRLARISQENNPIPIHPFRPLFRWPG